VRRVSRVVGSAVFVLAALASACASGGASSGGDAQPVSSSTDTSLKTGAIAADFVSRDIDGKTLRLSDYLGKQAVLLDFWATFCEPCLAEMPHLRRLYDANKSKGFVVIAIAMDGPETVAEVPNFAKRNQMTFPVALDEDSHVASIYNPKKSAPLSVLIDKTGKVVKIHEGYNPGDETMLAADVANVLDQAPQAK
jgi:peroxiredoxin